jgi:hypothetical protein
MNFQDNPSPKNVNSMLQDFDNTLRFTDTTNPPTHPKPRKLFVPLEIIELVADALGSTPRASQARYRMMLVCRAWNQTVRRSLVHRAAALTVLARDSTHLAAAHRSLGLTPQECADCEKTGRLGAAEEHLRGMCSGQPFRLGAIKAKAERMVAKTDRIVADVVAMASRAKVTKMYSVPGYHVAKRASRALTDLGIANEIVAGVPDNTGVVQTRRKCTGFSPGYKSGCCRECDGSASFYTLKVPTVYVRVL